MCGLQKMRKFKVDIAGKPFIDVAEDKEGRSIKRCLRVVFNSQASYTYNLGFLDLGIYNLSRETEVRQGDRISFSAGYDGEFDVIFTGLIISVIKEKEGPNVITRLLCRSGESPKPLPNVTETRPTIEKTFGRNTKITQLIRAIGEAWGKPVQLSEDQFDDCPVMSNGYSLNGDVCVLIDDLSQQFNFQWGLVQDVLIIDRQHKPVKGTPREVSLFTGMIGYPEAADDNLGVFVNVNMRLSPKIRLGTLIDLKSEFASYNTGNMYIIPPANGGKLSGQYRVVEVFHEGDSWGDRWMTKLKGIRNG